MQLPEISRRRALAYVLALLAVLALAGRVAFKDDPPEPPAAPLNLRAEPAPVRKLVVHVVGQVFKPGLYSLPDGSRVDDAISRAGGPKPRAALEAVNLAAPVADGQQIVLPSRREAARALAGGPVAGATPGARVHLNSATLEQLETLDGIGPSLAQRIIDYRTEHGGFRALEQLDDVSGFGPARMAALDGHVAL